MDLKVASVNVRGDTARVRFKDDPHHIVFVLNSGGWGISTTLERVWIEARSCMLATFHSPYQHPVNYTPFGFVQFAEGWTPQRFAPYWKAAHDYIGANSHRSPRLNDAWQIVACGHKDLEDIQGGRWSMVRRPKRR